MDVKITMSFEEAIINKAKQFAEAHNMSLSRLTEMIYKKMTTGNYKSLEDFPIADWVSEVAEGPAEYNTKPRTRKAMKKEYYKAKK
jgi:Family of unknown function (DUF6364)